MHHTHSTHQVHTPQKINTTAPLSRRPRAPPGHGPAHTSIPTDHGVPRSPARLLPARHGTVRVRVGVGVSERACVRAGRLFILLAWARRPPFWPLHSQRPPGRCQARLEGRRTAWGWSGWAVVIGRVGTYRMLASWLASLTDGNRYLHACTYRTGQVKSSQAGPGSRPGGWEWRADVQCIACVRALRLVGRCGPPVVIL